MPLDDLLFHRRPRFRIRPTGMFDDLIPSRFLKQRKGRQSDGRERRRADAVNHQSEINLGKTEINNVFFSKSRKKYFLQHFGVEGADPESDNAPNVAEDGRPHFLGHLLDVLVSDGEREFVLSRFGQNVGEGFVGKRLELVNEEVEGG